MPVDRTAEFRQIAAARQAHAHTSRPSGSLPPPPHRPPASSETLRPRSEFAAGASRVGADIHATAEKLAKLTRLRHSTSTTFRTTRSPSSTSRPRALSCACGQNPAASREDSAPPLSAPLRASLADTNSTTPCAPSSRRWASARFQGGTWATRRVQLRALRNAPWQLTRARDAGVGALARAQDAIRAKIEGVKNQTK